MAAKRTKRVAGGAKVKASVKTRTINTPGNAKPKGAPFNEQDPQRRLGNFQTAGEHARIGGARGAGIVGQTKRKSGTDKKQK